MTQVKCQSTYGAKGLSDLKLKAPSFFVQQVFMQETLNVFIYKIFMSDIISFSHSFSLLVDCFKSRPYHNTSHFFFLTTS
ncbi:CLUMA_CG010126, isoform A [Clunio marinus]|uniref:CLUMA_CG010126, isoform A n=1 Tax=Clunio marinus TaxID=568069 RepID=A0A1J1IEA1_9DIPT|nr:CLUMA_CG010126, isoform A [Clunio marinus]